MTLKEKVQTLCKDREISIRRLEKDLGIANGSVRKWDTVMPSGDKILALSKYFGVPQSYFFEDEDNPEYYVDPQVAKMMQEIKDNPSLRILFDASKNLSEEDLKFVLDMIERMK